jgi:hypothetical protein
LSFTQFPSLGGAARLRRCSGAGRLCAFFCGTSDRFETVAGAFDGPRSSCPGLTNPSTVLREFATERLTAATTSRRRRALDERCPLASVMCRDPLRRPRPRSPVRGGGEVSRSSNACVATTCAEITVGHHCTMNGLKVCLAWATGIGTSTATGAGCFPAIARAQAACRALTDTIRAAACWTGESRRLPFPDGAVRSAGRSNADGLRRTGHPAAAPAARSPRWRADAWGYSCRRSCSTSPGGSA